MEMSTSNAVNSITTTYQISASTPKSPTYSKQSREAGRLQQLSVSQKVSRVHVRHLPEAETLVALLHEGRHRVVAVAVPRAVVAVAAAVLRAAAVRVREVDSGFIR